MQLEKRETPKPKANYIYQVIGHNEEFENAKNSVQNMCRYTSRGLETIKFLSSIHPSESDKAKEQMEREDIKIHEEISSYIKIAESANDKNAVLTLNVANEDFSVRYFLKIEKASKNIVWFRKMTIGNDLHRDKNFEIKVGNQIITLTEFLKEFTS